MTLHAFSDRDGSDLPDLTGGRPLIVFDGVCVLCSGSARFVMRHDPKAAFRLTAAQSPAGQALYRHFGLDPTSYDTFLLVEGGRAFVKSDAALRVAARLGGAWTMATVLRLVPAPLRDRLYDAVARNRYRVFGKRDACFVPSADQAARFV